MNCSYETELELGERALFCTVYVEFDANPGEPMVRYYPDGSGYPGSPPSIEPTLVQVTTAEIGEGEILNREELAKIGGDGSWLRKLDELAEDVIRSDCEQWGSICEDMAEYASGDYY